MKKSVGIIIAVVLEIILISGSFCLGRFLRYKGTTNIGNSTIEEIEDIKNDVSNAGDNLSTGKDLLSSVTDTNELTVSTIENLKHNNEIKSNFINKMIFRMDETTKSLSDFEAKHKGIMSEDDYAWEQTINEAKELERLLADYEKIIKSYKDIEEK